MTSMMTSPDQASPLFHTPPPLCSTPCSADRVHERGAQEARDGQGPSLRVVHRILVRLSPPGSWVLGWHGNGLSHLTGACRLALRKGPLRHRAVHVVTLYLP